MPSVRATAVPAVTIQRSAVVSCVSGGSSPATTRTFAEMFVGPSKMRELLRLSVSFSFHRASMSAAGQNIVLSVDSFGTPWASISVPLSASRPVAAANIILRIVGCPFVRDANPNARCALLRQTA